MKTKRWVWRTTPVPRIWFIWIGLCVAAHGALDIYDKFKPTHTTGPLNLYVDPDKGDDSNDCRSAEWGSCATQNGAWDKIPDVVDHATTITFSTVLHGTTRLRRLIFGPTGSVAWGVHPFGVRICAQGTSWCPTEAELDFMKIHSEKKVPQDFINAYANATYITLASGDFTAGQHRIEFNPVTDTILRNTTDHDLWVSELPLGDSVEIRRGQFAIVKTITVSGGDTK